MSEETRPPDPGEGTTTPQQTPLKTRSWSTEVKEDYGNLKDVTLEGREDVIRQLMQTPTKRALSSPPPPTTPSKQQREEQELDFTERSLTIVTDEEEEEFTNETKTNSNRTANIEEFTSQETDDDREETENNNIIDPPDSHLTSREETEKRQTEKHVSELTITIEPQTVQTMRIIQAAIQEGDTRDTHNDSNEETETPTQDNDNTDGREENSDEDIELNYRVRMADFPPPPPQEEENNQDQERFVGKNTVITNISNLKNFDKITLIKDLKATIPALLPFVQCIGRRDRSDLEIALKQETPKQLQHQLITQGLNTHNTHLQFMPDTSDTKTTKVTLFGLPHELADEAVDEEMRTYGNVVTSYRHKERIDDLIIHSGRRVYTMSIDIPIPKLIQIAGHKVNTIYTDQKEHMERHKEEQKRKEKRAEEESRHWIKEQHKVRIVEEDGEKTQLCSFLHPEIKPEHQTLKGIKRLRENINLAQEKKLLFIEKHGKPPAEEYKRNGRTFARVPVDVHSVVAMAEGNDGILDKLRPSHGTTLDHLRALSLYAQFGFCEEGKEYVFNKRCFSEDQIEIWKCWSRRAALADPDFLPGAIDNFFQMAVEDAVGGYYICIPKIYTYIP